ncbi:MAG: tetratricopeptide repeat protein [Tepidisphaeraceae bacterium]|jgi:predicted O-linked N-acetylglucosamine transferase (SPINDLY family)
MSGHMTLQQQFESGVSHHQAGRFAEAERIYRQVLVQQPDHADALHLLGVLAVQAGRLDAAVDFIRRAIAICSTNAIYYSNLGNALKDKKQLDQAIASYRQAIRLKPDYAEAHNNLGIALRNKGQFDEAITAYREAIRLKPDLAGAHYNMGVAFRRMGQLDAAIAAYRQAIRLKPNYAKAHNNLGIVLLDAGQPDEAIAAYRQTIRLRPDFAEAHGNLLLALNYQPDFDAQAVLAEHRQWSDRFASPLAGEMTAHANERSPERRLRIGYVSADLRRHSVGYFFLPLLEHHDRRNFEIFCYANVQPPDDFTVRMKRCCDVWRNIVGVADPDVARLIRSDAIDILVDLSGHTDGNCLRVFARKPAPIQATYLGYANTTGMTAIDYRLTDALADPPGMTDELNVEKLWRLPTCAWCYDPLEEPPDIQRRPKGPITFGSFNAMAKINRRMVAIWAELLKRVAGSRLLLKSAGAGEASSRKRLTGQFAECGISGDRIEMRGTIADSREHLQVYGQLDVALDTFPYHGTTTTCQALWMGVPVVSLAGRTHVSRVGVSLLTQAGLPDLIAQTPEDYVAIASALAANRPRLDALRAGLRGQLRSSPLADGRRFAAEVEAAYRQMWRNWRRRGGNSSLQCPAP